MPLKLPAPAFGLLLLANACGFVQTDGPTESTATTTHALVRIERSAFIGAEAAATGSAFAGIVRMPREVDPEELLSLSGMGLALPAAGQCFTSTRERAAAPESLLGHAEFVDAGDVLLGATETQTQLAPRAFPSSQTELLSGVVYTSRDQASEPFPGGARYVLRTTGSEQLAPLEVSVEAPQLLSELSLGGAPLAEVNQVLGESGLLLGWQPGDPRDLVYVEISGAAGPVGVCSFRDSDGAGQLPRGLLGASGTGTLSFHRLREVAADVASLDATEVRFDFALSAQVAFR